MDQYMLGLAAAHLIDRARYVPERLIMRSLRFRALATINGLGEISFTVAALATVHVWGPSAIVIGTLARSVVTSSLFFYAAPRAEWFVRARLRAADVRDLFLYGLPILIANISDRAATRCDNFIVTKLFGLDVMARYQLSFSLAEMPIFNVAEHIGEVLMPSFSRMEPAQRERAVVRAPGLMGLIVSPLGVGLGAVAPTVVATFFNDRWGPEMGSMLRILSIMTVFRPMTWSAIAYAQAVQKPRLVMISSFSRAIVVLPLIAIFGYVGGSADWACIGAGIGYAFHAVFTIVATGAVTDMATGAYLRGVVRPLLPCIPMFFVVELVERTIVAPSDNHVLLVASLAAQIISGAIIYVGAAFMLVRPSVDELLRIGRESIRRRR
jgi:PST family polysaccharide transporter